MADVKETDRVIQDGAIQQAQDMEERAKQAEKDAKKAEKDAKKDKQIEASDAKIDTKETGPVVYPSSGRVRTLSIVAAAASAVAIAAQTIVSISQQTGKSRREKAGLEGAVRLTIAVTLARAIPSILSEIRTIRREMQRK